MRVSVVVPVYNAEDFVADAVESAVELPEVAEVVLVEDGSPDRSYEVCRDLAREHPKVELYTHPNRVNRGPGATRNRAIRESSHDYVAFLDADDFYCTNRFDQTVSVFERYPDADGVYEAVGTKFESQEEREKWVRGDSLTTIIKKVNPTKLFYEQQVKEKIGYPHLNGITIRKKIIENRVKFNESLKLHQDVNFFVKASICSNLYPGNISNPVAMRRVHEGNRISKKRRGVTEFGDKLKMRKSLVDWAEKNDYEAEKIKLEKKVMELCRKVIMYKKPDPRWVLSPLLQHALAAYKMSRLLVKPFFYKSIVKSIIRS
ncbi:glycosyltransferase involved in cell wall biosynthesis [Salinibacter ruber]|uniref:glycosyltransferase family 2 protein n=1 Tax=Salinibacter ruber TaxID=146919 RepID=UPI002167C3C3|nr:glycosyltransferase involved in cell wall biosynthesis [Salinibacter ruber]